MNAITVLIPIAALVVTLVSTRRAGQRLHRLHRSHEFQSLTSTQDRAIP